MNQYLLSTYGSSHDSDDSSGEPAGSGSDPTGPGAGDMAEMMQRTIALEADMDAAGAFVFGGHLHGPDASTVVATGGDGDTLITDGPYVETKEHLAGFYIINAADLDAALVWAGRVTQCVGVPIEVRPFGGTGRVADQMPA